MPLRRSPVWSGDPRVKPPRGSAVLDLTDSLTIGLGGFWSFNGPGPREYDATNYKNQGTYGALTFFSPTIYGGGIDLAGSSAKDVQVANAASLTPSTAVSVAMRVFWRASTEAYNSFASNEAVANGYALLGRSDQKGAWYVQGLTPIDPATTAIPFNKWSSIVGTARSGAMRFYLNGVLDTSNAGAGTLAMTGLTTLRIGSSINGSGRWLNGIIDYAAVWTRELTAGEVSRLSVEPWGMFKPVRSMRSYDMLAAVSGGGYDIYHQYS